VESLIRCEPSSGGNENLDLQAAGGGVRLFIVIDSRANLVSHELSIQGAPTGVFSNNASSIAAGGWRDDKENSLTGPPFTRSGDRVSGSMTLFDARGGSNTLDVRFDVRVPTDSRRC
jgi:hypothetical protein